MLLLLLLVLVRCIRAADAAAAINCIRYGHAADSNGTVECGAAAATCCRLAAAAAAAVRAPRKTSNFN